MRRYAICRETLSNKPIDIDAIGMQTDSYDESDNRDDYNNGHKYRGAVNFEHSVFVDNLCITAMPQITD